MKEKLLQFAGLMMRCGKAIRWDAPSEEVDAAVLALSVKPVEEFVSNLDSSVFTNQDLQEAIEWAQRALRNTSNSERHYPDLHQHLLELLKIQKERAEK